MASSSLAASLVLSFIVMLNRALHCREDVGGRCFSTNALDKCKLRSHHSEIYPTPQGPDGRVKFSLFFL